MAQSMLRAIRSGGQADPSSQPSDDDADGAGGDPGQRGACLGPCGAVRDDRADRLKVAASGHDGRPQPHAAPAPNHADPGASGGGGGGCPAQDSAGVNRRPARRGQLVPEAGYLALSPGPLPAAAWGGQYARSAGQIPPTQAQGI